MQKDSRSELAKRVQLVVDRMNMVPLTLPVISHELVRKWAREIEAALKREVD